MTLRELTYLVALAEYRHFGKASKACFVSQPAMSMQIKKLEKYLGVQLIERTNKSFLFTEIGEIIAEKAHVILQQIDDLRESTKFWHDSFRGELKLGLIPTLAPYLLPNIIPKLSKLFPKVMVYLAEEQSYYLVEKLKQGKLDAIILAPPIKERSLTVTKLFEEEFMLAVPRNHQFAKRKWIRQEELKNTSLLLLEDEHSMWEKSLAFVSVVKTSEFKNFRATSLETLRHMVASGIGITVFPKLACKNNPRISYIPFCAPKPTREVGMVWRISSAKRTLLFEIAQILKKTMSG